MKRVVLTLLILVGMTLPAAGVENPVAITYLGHACFTITAPDGTTILLDPYGDKTGYPSRKIKADAVFLSHEHFDHNYAAMAEPGAKILRGLTKAGDWEKINTAVGPFKIRVFPSFHDRAKGKERGKNGMALIEVGGIRILFCGDLGHPLPKSLVKDLGPIDVLLIPTGGRFTLGPEGAWSVCEDLRPKVAVPMHFRALPTASWPLASIDTFLSFARWANRAVGSRLELTADLLAAGPIITVMTPAP